jgi:hypothetical protein
MTQEEPVLNRGTYTFIHADMTQEEPVLIREGAGDWEQILDFLK